ncbi:hypothetical protein TWF696_008907 [Orbilia brochopaga]|uniref:Uncharacterized protein n=1 Tax=Orbilia brochopaga TaxID=3140254 RepID=A0AAV9UDP9_9PEZI
MSETVKRFKPTLQTATQTSHNAPFASSSNSPSSQPGSPLHFTDSPASYFPAANNYSPASASAASGTGTAGTGTGTGSSVASVPAATTPSEAKSSGFAFNMASLFGRSKTSGERHLSISLPRPK